MDIKEESTMKKSNDDNIITIVDNSEEVSENKEPLSRKESSSSSEYVVVCEQPSHLTSPVLEYVANETEINDAIRVVSSSKPLNALPSPTNHANAVVGKSIFYDCLDASPLNENNSFQKSDTDEDAPTYEIDQNDGNFTIFSNIVYLGSANINVPKCEPEILRQVSELNCSGNIGVNVKISIPNCCDGSVILYDEENDSVFSNFDIQCILFFARGKKDTPDATCFAFSWSHGDPNESGLYQCHVFRCNIPEAIVHVSNCFSKAFQRFPSTMTSSVVSDNFQMNSITSDMSGNPISQALYEYTLALEIRERDSKNVYSNVSREKSCFKVRNNCDKEISITVKPSNSDKLPPLFIERCFGVLLSVGKVNKQGELTALELLAPGNYVKGTSDFQIVAKWDQTEKPFEQVNNETAKRQILTLALDLVIKGIQEPVRFLIETNVKVENVDSQSSRFSNSFLFQTQNKRPLLKRFYVQLKDSGIENTWILSSIDPCDDQEEPVPSSSSMFNQKFKSFSKMVRSSSAVSFDFDDISQSDDPVSLEVDEDEPLASGTGEVSRDCSDDRLSQWAAVISDWQISGKRPKTLDSLIRTSGIPEALRCQIWQKLSFTENRPDLVEKYRILITKETKCEGVILRDIGRTFPAHKKFQEGQGNGQESLYKVSKAYSVFDQEVGYCQGLSFIAASLLLHMPEEDAFSVLVSIMFDYGLRDLYKENFETLHKCLFQLSCMIRDCLPDLHRHFINQNLELHMFASHWFLTLFTHRFPLPFVFHCIDLFLLDRINVIFQIAFTLLHMSEKELLSKDFEGILKYLKNTLPKKFRTEAKVMKFIKLACDFKVKKLKKYEDEYNLQKKENEEFERRFAQYQQKYKDDRKVWQNEISNLNEKIKKMEIEQKKYENIIHDYKQIIQRQELQLESLKSANINDTGEKKSVDNSNIDSMSFATQRIRELENELVMAKISQVESECKTQNLQHELNNLTIQMRGTSIHGYNANQPQSAVGSSAGSTLTNLKSLMTNAMNQVAQGATSNIPTFQSHISEFASQLSYDESKK